MLGMKVNRNGSNAFKEPAKRTVVQVFFGKGMHNSFCTYVHQYRIQRMLMITCNYTASACWNIFFINNLGMKIYLENQGKNRLQ